MDRKMTSDTLTLRSVQALCYRYPLSTPVVTSFGKMLNRPAVFIRAVDEDGVEGWGEAWCNFPAPGAEHRARLVNEVLAPAVVGRKFDGPAQVFETLTQGTDVLALQSGEAGPFAQAIAGIDLALWDLHARRRKLPLWRLLGGHSPKIKVYASGINPAGAAQAAEAALKRGHRALKFKVGFGTDTDLANLAALRAIAGAGMLAAAGENIASWDAFEQVLAENVIGVVQPDIAKWGGLSACAGLARGILNAGKTFCPHYLGGGIGLLASAHLLAGIGGDGWLEVDANDNTLRDIFCGPIVKVSEGTVTLDEESGLGVIPDLSSIHRYRTL